VPADRPLPNSYWALPDRLAAGEYPGSLNREQAGTKIRRLLQAGVTFFLDLTEAGNLRKRNSGQLVACSTGGCRSKASVRRPGLR
jgi:hypothetical protein